MKLITCHYCIMDSKDDPKLALNHEGRCNYCQRYAEQEAQMVLTGQNGKRKLQETIEMIRQEGKGKKYDCLIGLSGGVDSSYTALIAMENGLRPLCVHFDNGWNSEIAVKNIENIVNRANFDLQTYVIDWEEFKDLQLAYLRASVVDIEALTDHAIYGAMFGIAKEFGIKYVLGGHNVVTEGILPYHWTFNKLDEINIRDIHRKHGTKKLRKFPFYTRKMKKRLRQSKLVFINYLNWIPYNKENAKRRLSEELEWKDYGGKHHESIWTRFYQCYILPQKFGIDKRKAHLSSLICSGQITREEALIEMEKPFYSEKLLRADREFVQKKLGLSYTEFDQIMKMPPRSHREFETEGSIFNHYPVLKPLRPLWKKIKGR